MLTYGAEDQRSFFEKVRDRVNGILAWWRNLGKEEEKPTRTTEGAILFSDDELAAQDAGWQPRLPVQIAIVTLLFGLAVAVFYRRRLAFKGETAYLGLRSLLERAGHEIEDNSPPLEIERLALAAFPGAAQPVRRLVALYLRESFAQRDLTREERDELLADWREVRAEARSRGRRAPRSRVPAPA